MRSSHPSNRKKNLVLFGLAISFLVVVASLSYYFFFTPKGSDQIGRWAISKYLNAQEVQVREVKGSLSSDLIYKNLTIDELKWFPKGSTLKIQEVLFSLNPLKPKDFQVNLDNARLKMPGSDPIIFFGKYENHEFAINAFSESISANEILTVFPNTRFLESISGAMRSVDIDISGNFLKPSFKGAFLIEKISREDFTFLEGKGSVNLELEKELLSFQLYGDILLTEGNLSGKKTAVIQLKKGVISFKGDSSNPLLNFQGQANVGATTINVSLTGTLEKPSLSLSSTSNISEPVLLVMLATGKSWEKVDSSIEKKEISPAVAVDFIDYFVFGNSKTKFTEKLGFESLTLNYSDSEKGIGVKKKISENISLGYKANKTQGERQKVRLHKKYRVSLK